MVSHINVKRLAAMCAAVASLSTFGLAGSAMAVETPTTADTGNASITLNAAEGNSLDGHNFTFYRLGFYGDITASNDKVTGFTVNKVSDAVDAKIAAANKTAGVAADTDGKIAGFDAVGTLVKKTGSKDRDANSTDSQKILREEAKLLAASLGAKDSDVTGRKVGGTGKTMTVSNLSSGLYLIVDDHGSPMIVGTTINGLPLADSNLTLGSLTVKSKTVNIDKKVAHKDRKNAAPVDSKAGDNEDSASWNVGDVVDFSYTFTLPNKQNAKQTVVTDTMKGMTVKGTPVFKIGTTVIKPTVNGTNSTTTGVTNGANGFIATFGQDIIDQYENRQVTVTYQATVTAASRGNQASNTAKAVTTFLDGATGESTTPAQTTDVSDTDTAYVSAYDLNIKKTNLEGQALKGAQFKIRSANGDNKWMKQTNGSWSYVDKETEATPFETGENGLINIAGLGAGDYYVEETKVPDNMTSLVTVKFNMHISDGGVVTADASGLDDPGNLLGGAAKDGNTYTVTVKNIDALTELPQTGGLIGNTMIGVIVVAMAGGVAFLTVQSKRRREEHAL